ncbi:WD40 repeat domain-containing protein [Nostoc sp.]|uniref:WD40 repeat domain-containing protein n=1 Tax=Nostoc sp. TaxID=1180 RepID=UPI002FF6BAF4
MLYGKSEFVTPKPSTGNIEAERISLTTQLPESWRCVRTLKAHLGAVNAIAISPDGTTLVSGSDHRQTCTSKFTEIVKTDSDSDTIRQNQLFKISVNSFL